MRDFGFHCKMFHVIIHLLQMSWNPDPGLRNYNGPYPIRDLLAARQELINQLRNTDNVLLERTKPKIGECKV